MNIGGCRRTILTLIAIVGIVSLFADGQSHRLELPALKKGEALINHTGFSLVYSEKDEQAKWVAYYLTPDRAKCKDFSRDKESFREDPLIISGSATDRDYQKSGYSRGHLCPANDNTWSRDAMHDCFYFSNMSPQKQDFNGGIWKDMELYVHDMATKYDTLYIATGPVLKTKKHFKSIGVNEVSVPDYYFKVIMVYGKEPKAIGFLVPQTGYEKDFHKYACSVDKVEKATGIDFFYRVQETIQRTIEKRDTPFNR